MPFEQTVTIINNSGKIISTGKHLVAIFKDAKAAYQEKKASIRSEQVGIKRAQTFDVRPIYEEYDLYDEPETYYEPRYIEDRRRSHDDHDAASRASSRTHRSRRSHRSHHPDHDGRPGPPTRALTETNLQALSEVSSTAPSVRPRAYRSPYAETAPRDMALSRPTLASPTRARHMAAAPTIVSSQYTESIISEANPRDSMLVARPRSDPSLRKRKSIDMNLAYGNIPPDLESRVDLDPSYKNSPGANEAEARTLMGKIEGLLGEAQCIHHTATAIISHLQAKPEAAAAVALTLAELSTLLAKMSPGFLGVIQSGSPAIFALLASPQFLIGTGIAVGVTVVMFGGWKIVKKIQEAKAIQAEQVAIPMVAQPMSPQEPLSQPHGGAGYAQGARFGGGASSFDEALVLEEELSTIESWRRGIAPYGEDESVDMELISPEAMRSAMADNDAKTVRSSRTHRTSKTSKTHKTEKTHRSSRTHRHREAEDVPERKSSKAFADRDRDGGGKDDVSESGSQRSHRSHRSSRSKKDGGSRVQTKAIEEGKEDEENSLEMVLRPKEKKGNMLKQLFKKKKEKDEKEREAVSVLV